MGSVVDMVTQVNLIMDQSNAGASVGNSRVIAPASADDKVILTEPLEFLENLCDGPWVFRHPGPRSR